LRPAWAKYRDPGQPEEFVNATTFFFFFLNPCCRRKDLREFVDILWKECFHFLLESMTNGINLKKTVI
jgi:hypothetical protein